MMNDDMTAEPLLLPPPETSARTRLATTMETARERTRVVWARMVETARRGIDYSSNVITSHHQPNNRRHRFTVVVSAVTAVFFITLLVAPSISLHVRRNQQQPSSSPNTVNSFPSLDDTLEMARLSNLIYEFHDSEDDASVCARINAGNYTTTTTNNTMSNNNVVDWTCHWYRHERDKQGTQVMIVSSQARNYIAIVFCGTNDMRTSLTDADILTQPFGDVSCSASDENSSSHNEAESSSDVENSTTTILKSNWTLPDLPSDDDSNNSTDHLNRKVKIHAGFDNAVFCQGNLFTQLVEVFDGLLYQQKKKQSNVRLFATGHSLGAAASVLTAVALTEHYTSTVAAAAVAVDTTSSSSPPFRMTVLNFGCPQIGNEAWRDYVNDRSNLLKGDNLSIWRVVLGWDLVPRLPQLFYHVGHTVQLSHEYQEQIQSAAAAAAAAAAPVALEDEGEYDKLLSFSSSYNWWPFEVNDTKNKPTTEWDDFFDMPRGGNDSDDSIDDNGNNNDNKNATKLPVALAYYHHYGNETLGYASIPLLWSTKPYFWVPGALESHRIDRYVEFLLAVQSEQEQQGNYDDLWLSSFVQRQDDDDKNDTRPPDVDDDFWVEPPDDDASDSASAAAKVASSFIRPNEEQQEQ